MISALVRPGTAMTARASRLVHASDPVTDPEGDALLAHWAGLRMASGSEFREPPAATGTSSRSPTSSSGSAPPDRGRPPGVAVSLVSRPGLARATSPATRRPPTNAPLATCDLASHHLRSAFFFGRSGTFSSQSPKHDRYFRASTARVRSARPHRYCNARISVVGTVRSTKCGTLGF